MAVEIDEKLFTWAVIAVIVMCLICAAALAFKLTDGFSFLKPAEPVPDYQYADAYGDTASETEDGPWGYKEFAWEYGDKQYNLGVDIPKSVYRRYCYGISGTVYPQDIADYVIYENDGNAVSSVADEMRTIMEKNGIKREEYKLGLVLSFVKSISYQTDSETDHSEGYPRAPAVTLAEQTGDSADHVILAAAILKELGYATSIIMYPATSTDAQTVIPQASALGLISNNDHDTPAYMYIADTPDTGADTDADTDAYTAADTAGDENDASYGSSAENLTGSVTDGVTESGTVTIRAKQTYKTEKAQLKKQSEPYFKAILNPENTFLIPFWCTDTTEKGYPEAAFYGITPVIYTNEDLMDGKSYNPSDNFREDYAKDMGIHSESLGKYFTNTDTYYRTYVSGNITYGKLVSETYSGNPSTKYPWMDDEEAYYKDVWYPSGISWDLGDKWKIYDNALNMRENNRSLYTPWGYMQTNTTSAWRITYEMKTTGSSGAIGRGNTNEFGISPYNDVRFILYSVDRNTGETKEIRQWGWQNGYDSGTKKSVGPFSAGEYILGIFARNLDEAKLPMEVTVEYSGRMKPTDYEGEI